MKSLLWTSLISGTPNDIVACIFDYLKGTEIAYIDKVNSKDIDLSLYPKGTLFLVVIINNDFSGKQILRRLN